MAKIFLCIWLKENKTYLKIINETFDKCLTNEWIHCVCDGCSNNDYENLLTFLYLFESQLFISNEYAKQCIQNGTFQYLSKYLSEWSGLVEIYGFWLRLVCGVPGSYLKLQQSTIIQEE